jgi:hypothetical protein
MFFLFDPVCTLRDRAPELVSISPPPHSHIILVAVRYLVSEVFSVLCLYASVRREGLGP